MASYSENYKIIKDALQKAFSEEDLSIRFQNIKIVQSQINNYLERYRIISSGIKQRYEILAQEMPDQSEMTRRYFNSRFIKIGIFIRRCVKRNFYWLVYYLSNRYRKQWSLI